ncbi:myb-like protein X [Argopecten irradians]|uniref:myb-like protein X n=1 Tax=Argopecten irradians TaxID=31199 RepID=UPI0037151666
MAKCSSRQLAFVFFNFLFLCLGLVLVGFVSWTLATIPNANEFISGTHIVTLTSLCLGFVILVIGGIGCAAGFCKGLCILKTYVAFMITLLFLELGLVFFIYAEQTQIPSVMVDSWGGLNADTQYKIQEELKCCGIENYTEYGTDVESYPSSCFVVYDVTGIIEKTIDTLFTANCLTQMQNWLNDHIPIWASVILGIAVIECLGGLTSCIFLQRVHKKLKVKPNEDEEQDVEDTNMESVTAGSSKDKTSTEQEEEDNRINSSGLIVVSEATERDIQDNTTIDYLNENSDDSSSTHKDEDTISNASKERGSILLVASASKKTTSDREISDIVPEDEVETLVLTQTNTSDVTDDMKDENDDNISNHSLPDQTLVLVPISTKKETNTTANDRRDEENINYAIQSNTDTEKSAEKEEHDTKDDGIESVVIIPVKATDCIGHDKRIDNNSLSDHSASDQSNMESFTEKVESDGNDNEETKTAILLPIDVSNGAKSDEIKEIDNILTNNVSAQSNEERSTECNTDENDEIETVVLVPVKVGDARGNDNKKEDDSISTESTSNQTNKETSPKINGNGEIETAVLVNVDEGDGNENGEIKDDISNKSMSDKSTRETPNETDKNEIKGDKSAVPLPVKEGDERGDDETKEDGITHYSAADQSDKNGPDRTSHETENNDNTSTALDEVKKITLIPSSDGDEREKDERDDANISNHSASEQANNKPYADIKDTIPNNSSFGESTFAVYVDEDLGDKTDGFGDVTENNQMKDNCDINDKKDIDDSSLIRENIIASDDKSRTDEKIPLVSLNLDDDAGKKDNAEADDANTIPPVSTDHTSEINRKGEQ